MSNSRGLPRSMPDRSLSKFYARQGDRDISRARNRVGRRALHHMKLAGEIVAVVEQVDNDGAPWGLARKAAVQCRKRRSPANRVAQAKEGKHRHDSNHWNARPRAVMTAWWRRSALIGRFSSLVLSGILVWGPSGDLAFLDPWLQDDERLRRLTSAKDRRLAPKPRVTLSEGRKEPEGAGGRGSQRSGPWLVCRRACVRFASETVQAFSFAVSASPLVMARLERA